MIHRLIAVLCISGIALSHLANAADEQGQFGVRGAGLVSCAVFEHARATRSEVYHVVAAWMDGYITGANQYANNTYDIASFESTELLTAMVSDYCKQHPDVLVFAVVNSLVKKFATHRLHNLSRKQRIVLGKRRTLLYTEIIHRMQGRLSDYSFYHGKIGDGFTPQVEKALAAFQTSIGLKSTGFPDQLTLWRLFNPNE